MSRLLHLTVVEEFQGSDDFGNHAPGHKVYVNAEGEYAEGKLEINGQPIGLHRIQITAVQTEDDAHKNFAFVSHTSIRLMEDVFRAFVHRLQAQSLREVRLALCAFKNDPAAPRDALRLNLHRITLDQKLEMAIDRDNASYRRSVLLAFRRVEVLLVIVGTLIVALALARSGLG
jgi:hypothetical protein